MNGSPRTSSATPLEGHGGVAGSSAETLRGLSEPLPPNSAVAPASKEGGRDYLAYATPLESRVALPRWIAPLIATAIAALLQITVRPVAGEYVERIVLDSGIAVILAVSLNIVNGYTGQFSIGHAAFFAIGGYTAAGITYYTSLQIWNDTGSLHFWGQTPIWLVATLAGGLIAALAGWIVGLPSLRLRGDYLAIVTLGFGEIVRVLLQQTNGQFYTRDDMHAATPGQWVPPPIGGALGFINIPKATTLFWSIFFAGLTLIIAWRLKRSTFGRSMIAIRENEIAAESMGVNVTRLKVWAFVIGAYFAGVAGSLSAHEMGQILTPGDAGFARSFDVVIMVVLGGLGSISGATLAAILITVANEWLRGPTHIYFAAIPILAGWLAFWPQRRKSVFAFVMLAISLFVTISLGITTLLHVDLTTPAMIISGVLLVLIAILYTRSIPAVLAIAVIEGGRAIALYENVDLGEYRMIIFALVLILTMILRPSGLFGTTEVTDVLAMRRQLMRDHDPARGFSVEVKP